MIPAAALIDRKFIDAIEEVGAKAEQRIYTELRRRKRSKKARQRLVRNILKRGRAANGAFAHKVCTILGLRQTGRMMSDFLRNKMEQPSFTRQVFSVKEPMTPEEKAMIRRAYDAEQTMSRGKVV